MKVELDVQQRAEAIASLQRHFSENLEGDPLGEMRAGLLVTYILEEIGPAIYNKAVADAQERMQMRAADLTSELFADEFQYWAKQKARRR